jgi:hypothetical protein
MDNEMREMRELLIELRLTLHHLTSRVDVALSRSEGQITRLEARLYAAERNIWIASGVVATVTTLLPYLVQWVKR